MTYFEQVSKDKLQDYQAKSRQVIQRKHLQRCRQAYTIYSKSHNILEVCEKLKVKERQAYRLVAKGKSNV